MAVSGNVGEVQTAEPRVLPYQFEPPSGSRNRQEANATHILANDGYDRLGNSTWCECGNCAVMDKVEECNCCTESHEIMQKLTSRRHNQTVLASLEPGDLIEFPRGAYSHWAVYIDDGKVVHLAGDENDGINGQVNASHLFTISGQRFGKAIVKKEDFWDVVETSKARKSNRHDKTHSPLSKTKIVENALARIGRVGYNVLFDNCEHFANWCRYGLNKSEQADTFMGAAVLAGAFGLTAGLVYLLSPSKDKKQKQ